VTATRRNAAAVVPPSWQHLLTTGCYGEARPDDPHRLKAFLAAGAALRNNWEPIADGLRAYGPLLRHRAPLWAERALKDRTLRPDLCRAHDIRLGGTDDDDHDADE
jgi:hypothetical protein